MDKLELYAKVCCALTHDVEVCNKCKKCGEDGPTSRINLVKKLADEFGCECPFDCDVDE